MLTTSRAILFKTYTTLWFVIALCAAGCIGSVTLDDMSDDNASIETQRGRSEEPIGGDPMNEAGREVPPLMIFDMGSPSPSLDMLISGGDTSDPEPDDPNDLCGALTECAGRCVDVTSDPAHCGACGSPCVIQNGDGSCVGGSCFVRSCNPGYSDQDGRVQNGCESFETAPACTSGLSCATSCGTTGTTSCRQGVMECMPPAESCNLTDDDCDGQCDEGSASLGCRVGIHRGFGEGQHIYSSSMSQVTSGGYMLEVADYFYLYQSPQAGTRALYLCMNESDHAYLSSQSGCPSGRQVSLLGYMLEGGGCGSQPLYALYRAESDNHLYTRDPDEVSAAAAAWNYQDRGILGYVWRSP